MPVTEFCGRTPEPVDLGDGKKPVRGEMWFAVPEQPMFAIAGFWQQTVKGTGCTMVTCDPNELVAPIHPKATVTILHDADWDHRLGGSYENVVALQRPYPAEQMTVRGPVFPDAHMKTDRDQHDGAAGRRRGRRITWAFIAITIVMAILTLGLPYVIHLSRPTKSGSASGR